MGDMDVAAAYAAGDSYEVPAPRRHVHRELADEVMHKVSALEFLLGQAACCCCTAGTDASRLCQTFLRFWQYYADIVRVQISQVCSAMSGAA